MILHAVYGVIGLVISGAIAWRAYKHESLTKRASIAAVVFGTVSMAADPRFGASLLTFFLIGATATSWADENKQKAKTTRGLHQVLCTGLVPTLLAFMFLARRCAQNENRPWEINFEEDWVNSILAMAILGYYACDLGDTLSSELGELSTSPPVFITRPWKVVPKGTNGGVSMLGTLSAVLGGLLLGVGFVVGQIGSTLMYREWHQIDWPETKEASAVIAILVKLALFSGLFGSFVDSMLGALFQSTEVDVRRRTLASRSSPKADVKDIGGLNLLSNEIVNLVSCSITAAVCAGLGYAEFQSLS